MSVEQTAPPRALRPAERIAVAVDVADRVRLLELVQALKGEVGLFKLGKEVFTALGPAAVELVRAEGAQVFLDLKYHDIPNTVAGAVHAAGRLGVRMLTVHASGGEAMLRAADLPIVLHAHDELAVEGNHVERLNAALTDPIDWAPGLPLAASVTLFDRYWKD